MKPITFATVEVGKDYAWVVNYPSYTSPIVHFFKMIEICETLMYADFENYEVIQELPTNFDPENSEVFELENEKEKLALKLKYRTD